jgi:hypothetical protein
MAAAHANLYDSPKEEFFATATLAQSITAPSTAAASASIDTKHTQTVHSYEPALLYIQDAASDGKSGRPTYSLFPQYSLPSASTTSGSGGTAAAAAVAEPKAVISSDSGSGGKESSMPAPPAVSSAPSSAPAPAASTASAASGVPEALQNGPYWRNLTLAQLPSVGYDPALKYSTSAAAITDTARAAVQNIEALMTAAEQLEVTHVPLPSAEQLGKLIPYDRTSTEQPAASTSPTASPMLVAGSGGGYNNGVLQRLATRDFTRPYVNPATDATVAVRVGDSFGPHTTSAAPFVSHAQGSFAVAAPAPRLPWVMLDFGANRVRATAYSLRHWDIASDNALRHWVLEATNSLVPASPSSATATAASPSAAASHRPDAAAWTVLSEHK